MGSITATGRAGARGLIVSILTLVTLATFAAPAPAAGGSLVGSAFEDVDRDGVLGTGETLFTGQQVNLYDGNGTYLRNAKTDGAGRYAFTDLAAGTYRVSYRASDWWALQEDFVPTTTGSLRPDQWVSVGGSTTTADFGWRRIVRSTDSGAPITSFTGPSGIRIKSYNDVVNAREIHDMLMQGSLIGPEAAETTIRHDLGTNGTTCSTGIVRQDGRYASFSASCHVKWLSWLSGADRSLFHEYGHVWSLYNAYLVQQDPDLLAYLEARGIDPNDERLETSHGWSRREMIAEDYRQLFGSPAAQQAPQENRDIPVAADVPGLKEFLSTTFTAEPGSSPEPSPAPEPEPSPTPEPDPSPTSDPEQAAVHIHDLEASGTTAKGKNWLAQVQVAVQDLDELPISGASVTFAWEGRKTPKTASCVTGADGRCSISLEVANKLSDVSFTVAGVEKTEYAYLGEQNHDADGDSSGSEITVLRP